MIFEISRGVGAVMAPIENVLKEIVACLHRHEMIVNILRRESSSSNCP